MTESSNSPVAIVTGAAGGIGSALVDVLLRDGYRVIAEDISPKVQDMARPGSVVPFQADVTQPETATQAVELANSSFGRLDLLVNNAAHFLRKSVLDTTDEDFDRLLTTNVRGAFFHVRAAIPSLAASQGNIINLGSISGLVGSANQSVYSITKGALVQLTRQLAIELAPQRIRVNAVAPGAVDTDFAAKGTPVADPDPEASRLDVLARHPLGRTSTPQDIAEAIGFLVSPKASGITGVILSVDGGYVAR